MGTSWITLHPEWYIQERNLLNLHYPDLRVDEGRLREGVLTLYGSLTVRPPGGAKEYPVRLEYPEGTPFEHPCVTPIESQPRWKEDGSVAQPPRPRLFDYRHQMPSGSLCLFQRETRSVPGGDVLNAIEVLQRAEKWFLGRHTGHWPPDTAQSELELHFRYWSDVLVDRVFFDPNIVGHGQLFFACDLRRYLWDRHPKESCPMILTALTEETVIIKPVDARRQLGRIYPWIGDSLWDAQKLMATRDLSQDAKACLERGYWWSLAEEPRPFHDGAGFLRELARGDPPRDAWAMVSAQLGTELTFEEKHYLGLRYPARDGGVEWLILCMLRGPRKVEGGIPVQREPEKCRSFEKSPMGVIRVHRVEPEVLRLRNRGVVAAGIAEKTVALIGLGAIGSEVAELLAKAGVGRFRLCDCDYLSTGNVARHVGGISDFGARKTRVVKKRLLEINPYLDFANGDILAGSAVASLERLQAFMDPADLTICTTADESAEGVVNQVAVLGGKHVLYGRSMRRASMGRAFLVRPGRDACKQCLATYLKDGRAGRSVPADWIDVQEDQEEVVVHECGRPVIAGSAIDLSFIAGLVARVALDVLEDKDTHLNHWLWSRIAAGDLDPRLAAPMSPFIGTLEPRPLCPACQEPDVVELLMTEEVRRSIISETESSTDAETGGVLIGFVDADGRGVAVRATGPGPEAKRSATLFRRDVAHVQQQLDEAAEELGCRGMYIGEWHSHLVRDPAPSVLDIESLFAISKVPNYLTRCPVMVIAGLDSHAGTVANLRSWVFPVGGRKYDIPHQVVSVDVAKDLRPREVDPCEAPVRESKPA